MVVANKDDLEVGTAAALAVLHYAMPTALGSDTAVHHVMSRYKK